MSDTASPHDDSSAPGHTAGKSCFVIMPFGIKQDIDFDHIYEAIFKRTIKALALDGKRCDESGRTGLIHKDMIERIISSDVVIVDITTNNPNVLKRQTGR